MVIGGKNYNVVGTDSAPLLLKNKAGVKILWGNKFIDLIKNGKIASEETIVFKNVSTKEEISKNGAYVVNDSDAVLSINGSNFDIPKKSVLPKGTIVMFNGSEIPEGWAICNGENETPNLINQFIKGSNTPGASTEQISLSNGAANVYLLIYIMKL